jgi:O-antigen biosynthesis protein
LRPAYRGVRAAKRILRAAIATSASSDGLPRSPFDDLAYEAWLASPKGFRSVGQSALAASLVTEAAPLFSIVMPVCDPPLPFLEQAVDSVLRQSFTDLELILVDDACTARDVISYLDHVSSVEERVTLIRNPERRGIGLTTESGVSSSRGLFVGFVDHDDILREFSLELCAGAIAADPSLQAVFTDEDKISAQGQRFHPRFKSGFDPIRLLHENYINHFFACQRDVLHTASVSFASVDGAQDWNLVLTAARFLARDQIAHVPYVGYSWRQSDGQFSQQRGSSAMSAAEDVLRRHLAEIGAELTPRPDLRLRGAFRLGARPGTDRAGVIAVLPLVSTSPDSQRRTAQNIAEWLKAGCERIMVLCAESGARQFVEQEFAAEPRVVTRETGSSSLREAVRDEIDAHPGSNGAYLILGEEIAPLGGHVLRDLVAYLGLPGVGMVGPRILSLGAKVENLGALVNDEGLVYVGGGLDPFDPGYFGEAFIPHEVAALDPRAVLVESRLLDRLLEEASGSAETESLVEELARGCWQSGSSVVLVPSVSVLRRERVGDEAQRPARPDGDSPRETGESPVPSPQSLFRGAPRLPRSLKIRASSYVLNA